MLLVLNSIERAENIVINISHIEEESLSEQGNLAERYETVVFMVSCNLIKAL